MNTASRLESGGLAGHVNVSRATFERVRGHFDCEYRGKIVAEFDGATATVKDVGLAMAGVVS